MYLFRGYCFSSNEIDASERASQPRPGELKAGVKAGAQKRQLSGEAAGEAKRVPSFFNYAMNDDSEERTRK